MQAYIYSGGFRLIQFCASNPALRLAKNVRGNFMRTYIFILIIVLTKDIFAQDYSILGKSINYSDTYRKAKRFQNIDNALLAPDQVLYLDLTVDKDGINYRKFVDNHSKFINLRKLIIDNRWYQLDLPVVPDVSAFKNLEFLQLFNLPKLNFDKLTSLTNLKYLDLDACELKNLPSAIINLKQLECLILSLNYLSTLPDNIGEMTNLKEIDLTNNCFIEIPKSIGQVKELLYLDINNAEIAGQFINGKLFCKNTLTVFPTILYDCKKIKKVHLYKVAVDKATKDKLKSELNNIKFTF